MSPVSIRKSRTARRIDSVWNSPAESVAAKDTSLELLSLVASAATRDELYHGLLGWLSSRPGWTGGGFFAQEDEHVHCVSSVMTGPVFENSPDLRTAIESAAALAAKSGRVQIERVSKVRNLAIVAVPTFLHEHQTGSLVGAIVADPQSKPNDSHILTAAAYATLWHANREKSDTQQQLSVTAAAFDLVSGITTADSFRSAVVTTVNSLREHLQAHGVVLGLARNETSRCRVSAISGLAEFDTAGSLTRDIENALDECLSRDRITIAPADDANNRDSLLSHEKLRHAMQAARIVSHPLKTAAGQIVGAWLVIDETSAKGNENAALLMQSAAPRAAATLAQKRQAEPSLFRRGRSRTGFRWLLRWVVRAGVAAAVATAVLMTPVPYKIRCACSAEPQLRRFVVATFEGLVERTHVEQGDIVKQGQQLAEMDGRDIRWELAGLTAEKEQAAKDHDAGLLTGDAAAAQRAILERQRIDAREQVLVRQREQLSLTSPIDGIVLNGHLDRVENAPVSMGQALYEIAPLSAVCAEVAIPHDDFAHVRSGAEVAIRFDGLDHEFRGTVQRIHPRSELRDNENVFIAEVALDNTDDRLRPGMSGYARITGDTRSLGWNLFHKPWEHLRRSLPF